MIDPSNITNYELSDSELEEHLLFWILVAGKTAKTTAVMLEKLISKMRTACPRNMSPFGLIRYLHSHSKNPHWLAMWMKETGIGCYKNKARGFIEVAYSNLNLKTCTVEDLEKVHSIGLKTSRCFVIHSRKNAQHAGLDVHVLSYLKDKGYDVPKQTPASKKKYLELEGLFIKLANRSGMPLSEFDLKIWRKYSGN